MLTPTAPVLPALGDHSLRPRHTQPSGPNAQCPTTQPWFAFRTAVSLHVPCHLGSSRSVNSLSFRDAGTGATRSCTYDDHTSPSCLVAYPLAKMEYWSWNTLVLPDPWLTQEGPVTFPARALCQLFVRSCDLAHHGLYCSHVCAYTHHSSLRPLLFGVCPRCPSVLIWTNLKACDSLLAPLSGITLPTRAIRSQHYILSNSYKLVRAPRLLCRCRPPHECHMVQRLQVLCPAHRLHLVLPILRFRRAPPALSQVTFCQLRSLRLPRSSPLLHSWSVASLLMLPRRSRYQSPPHLWMPLRRLFHTPLPLRTFSAQLSFEVFLAPPSTHDVLCPTCSRPVPSLLLDAAVQTPLYSLASHDASTQLPLTEFFIGCIFSNEPLDRQGPPSAHCNADSATPPQPADIDYALQPQQRQPC